MNNTDKLTCSFISMEKSANKLTDALTAAVYGDKLGMGFKEAYKFVRSLGADERLINKAMRQLKFSQSKPGQLWTKYTKLMKGDPDMLSPFEQKRQKNRWMAEAESRKNEFFEKLKEVKDPRYLIDRTATSARHVGKTPSDDKWGWFDVTRDRQVEEKAKGLKGLFGRKVSKPISETLRERGPSREMYDNAMEYYNSFDEFKNPEVGKRLASWWKTQATRGATGLGVLGLGETTRRGLTDNPQKGK